MVADFWLDGWLVQPRYNIIIAKDRTVFLRPVTMSAVVYLARRAPETVSAREILQAVWNNPALPLQSLTCILNEIQEAFGDPSSDGQLFRVMPDLSCRLNTEVNWHPAPGSA